MKSKTYELPYRVGRKQGKVVLDAKGLEVCNFPTPQMAQEYCDFQNANYCRSRGAAQIERLTLTELAPYLPYKLLCEWRDVRDQSSGTGVLIELKADDGAAIEEDRQVFECVVFEVKPYLRPLCQLESFLTYKSETIIPLLELAKIAFKNIIDFTSARWSFVQDEISYGVRIVSTDSEESFRNLYFGFNKVVKSFQATIGINSSFQTDFYVKHQSVLFQMLHEWHFDLYDLIERKLAHSIS